MTKKNEIRKALLITTIIMVLVFSLLQSVAADEISVSTNKPPVITGVGGPTTLKISEVGTWTINAYDPDGNYLTYNIDWGDNPIVYNQGSTATTVQSTSLQHSYSNSGTYTIIFTVKDDQGAITKSTITVNIQASIQTCKVTSNNCLSNEECCSNVCVRSKESTIGTCQNRVITSTCTESDNDDIYTKGTIFGLSNVGVSWDKTIYIESYDDCEIESNPNTNLPNTLYEYYCIKDSNGRMIFASNSVTCANGCANGACIRQTIIPSVTVLSPNGGETYNAGQQVTIRWRTNNIKVNPNTLVAIMDDRISDWQTLSLFGSVPALNYAKLVSSNSNNENVYEYTFTVPSTFRDSLPAQYKEIYGGRHYSILVNVVDDGQISASSQKIIEDLSDNTFTFTNSGGNNAPVIKDLSGPRTLNVNDNGKWTVSAYDPDGNYLSYSVNWGDQKTVAPTSTTTATAIAQTSTFEHVYSAAGTYTITFTVTDNKGLSTTKIMIVSVSDNNANIFADIKINGVDNPAEVEYNTPFTISWTTTPGSTCSAYDHHVVMQDGSLWTDYNRLKSSGSMIALARHQQGYFTQLTVGIDCIYNGKQFKDEVKINVRPPSINQPPVITSIGGPTNLNVYETGTWKINAYDPESGYLQYNVDWGDADNRAQTQSTTATPLVISESTFQHTYNNAGIYTITFSVSDNNKFITKSITTVKVGGIPTINITPVSNIYVDLDQKFNLISGQSAKLNTDSNPVVTINSITTSVGASNDKGYVSSKTNVNGYVSTQNKNIYFSLASGEILKINGVSLVVIGINGEIATLQFIKTISDTTSCDSGCFTGSSCIAVGIRTKDSREIPIYCDLDKSVKTQKYDGSECQNNFECDSNTCSSGVCVNINKQLQANNNAINSIIDWIRSIFGYKGSVAPQPIEPRITQEQAREQPATNVQTVA